jgi:Flp pilus assembly protein TadD
LTSGQHPSKGHCIRWHGVYSAQKAVNVGSHRLAYITFFVWTAAAVQDAYERGATLFRNGHYEEAATVFEELTATEPRNARGWRGLGIAHASRGNYRLAEAPLRRACEIDSRVQDGCYYYGLASYNLGRYQNAIESYRKALKSGGRLGRVHTGLGLAYEALGRAADAERELLDGIARDDRASPPDFHPRVEYGAFLFRQGRLEEAKTAFAQAPRDSPRVHFELGRILTQSGKLEEAAERLNQAISLDPSYAAAHLLLGRVYLRLGRAEDGERQTAIGQKLIASKP